MTLHILINPVTETIVNAVHDDQLDGLRRFVKHHTEEQGQPLARIIVKRTMIDGSQCHKKMARCISMKMVASQKRLKRMMIG